MEHDLRVTRRRVLAAAGVLPAAQGIPGTAPPVHTSPAADIFSFDGSANIREENHFGIINQAASIGVNYRDATALSGLFAPPYASSDFFFEMRLFGDRVNTVEYRWSPTEVFRRGAFKGISVTSVTGLAAEMRAGVLAITLENNTASEKNIPLLFSVTGSLEYVKFWGFPRPDTAKKITTAALEQNCVVRGNEGGAIAFATTLADLVWEPWSSHWIGSFRLTSHQSRTFYFAWAVGNRDDAIDSCRRLISDPQKAMGGGRQWLAAKTRDLFSKLPALEAAHPGLVKYYNRSLMHLLTNQWRVPEFVVNPCYSTGAMKGGCVGCYLWDYGLMAELLPLYDPEAVKAHLRQFLNIDITKHFLFNPMDGKADGPWYPANQGCILSAIYYYVLHTGDSKFLNEEVAGRTVLDWAIFNATYRDDLSRPAVLVDYGKKVGHLELRRQYTYEQVLPDLNGKRYDNYQMAWHLSRAAGKPEEYLRARMEPLRQLLKESLWSERDRWFYYDSEAGGKQLRFTNIIYLLFGCGVLDKEQEAGLLSHLNEREFLSEFGIHSMSKLDPAYDQVDIDHGGGGSYVAFPACIAESFYKAGYPRPAEDILRRTLWWAERLPFWGDSIVANEIEYRRDTPLQSDIAAAAGAQSIIFGMFGLKVTPDGGVQVDPKPPRWCSTLRLNGVRLRGRTFDVAVKGENYEIWTGAKVLRRRVGQATLLS